MEWKEEKEKTATFGRDLDKMHATFSKMNSAYEMKDNSRSKMIRIVFIMLCFNI